MRPKQIASKGLQPAPSRVGRWQIAVGREGEVVSLGSLDHALQFDVGLGRRRARQDFIEARAALREKPRAGGAGAGIGTLWSYFDRRRIPFKRSRPRWRRKQAARGVRLFVAPGA